MIHPMIYTQFFQVSKFLDVLQTPHFPFGIQTFLVLFMVEIISFFTQMRLAPFPLLASLLALIAITFPFFFFLIKYGVAAFLSTFLIYVLEILLVGFCLSFCFFLSPVFALHWKDLWPSL
jgi:hypothetical protein